LSSRGRMSLSESVIDWKRKMWLCLGRKKASPHSLFIPVGFNCVSLLWHLPLPARVDSRLCGIFTVWPHACTRVWTSKSWRLAPFYATAVAEEAEDIFLQDVLDICSQCLGLVVNWSVSIGYLSGQDAGAIWTDNSAHGWDSDLAQLPLVVLLPVSLELERVGLRLSESRAEKPGRGLAMCCHGESRPLGLVIRGWSVKGGILGRWVKWQVTDK
jgi:hypothetical protein